MTNTKLIILDRDGVINIDSREYIKSPEEWKPIPGSLQAIAKLYQAGYRVAVATNQSGIARGLFNQTTLNLIHQKMQRELAAFDGKIENIFYCPHQPADLCECRKPKIGLLEQIANYFQIPLIGVPFVGDSTKDIEAALQMQCSPFLVMTGSGEETLAFCRERKLEIPTFADLNAVAEYLLGSAGKKHNDF